MFLTLARQPLALFLLGVCLWAQAGRVPFSRPAGGTQKPNVLLIIADDLGWGELGCYGQERIRTPRIDAFARKSVRFTRAYSGAPVCAPSRCALITGQHLGHCTIRDNVEVQPEGQQALPAGTPNLFRAMKDSGYATACIGKWGLGAPGSEGDPLSQGVDRFFGFNCQRLAHNHYPTQLWSDARSVPMDGKHWASDLFTDESVRFVQSHADSPWMLAYTTTLPHLALQVPERYLGAYEGAFSEVPYDGRRGYLAHPTPRAAYAAMITAFDAAVGRLLDTLDSSRQAERTLVIITSDNGPATAIGGADPAFFRSTGGLRGEKGSAFEGGWRVPLLIGWNGHIPGGRTSEAPCIAYDLWPTIAEAIGASPPPTPDGQSLVPYLVRDADIKDHPLYVDFPGYGGWEALILGKWKALRTGTGKNPTAPFQLFDLNQDPSESTDLAAKEPTILSDLLKLREKLRLSPGAGTTRPSRD